MAFTDTQRAQIRYWLGWPAVFRQTFSELEQAMSAIATFPETQVLIEGDLANLANLETLIQGVYQRLQATEVGTIRLEAQKELMTLRSEGRRFSGRIARTLGVPALDIWSGSLPSNFSPAWNA